MRNRSCRIPNGSRDEGSEEVIEIIRDIDRRASSNREADVTFFRNDELTNYLPRKRIPKSAEAVRARRKQALPLRSVSLLPAKRGAALAKKRLGKCKISP